MTDDRTLPMTEQVPMSDFERAFRDACDEAGCEYDNEALLVAIANLTSYPDMLWEWFTVRRGSDDMRANASQGGLSADDFKQMLDEHEANLIPATPDSTASLKARLAIDDVLLGFLARAEREDQRHLDLEDAGNGDQEHKDCDCRACGIIRNARAQCPDLVAAVRGAFPHFQEGAPITPEAIKSIGKEYLEMVMGWEPQKTEIEFADDDGNIRKIVYKPGEYEAGSFPGWVLSDDASPDTSTDRADK